MRHFGNTLQGDNKGLHVVSNKNLFMIYKAFTDQDKASQT